MTESLIKLCAPFIIGLVIFVKEYGRNGFEWFQGLGITRLGIVALFLLHLSTLIYLGEEWFCSSCGSKTKSSVFLLPGIGYSLFVFAPAFSVTVFANGSEKMQEQMIAFLGLILLAGGVLSILLAGDY